MNELYTIREVSQKLKISQSSVYRYVENGSFPHRRLGSNIRFTKENIEDFLSGSQAKSQIDVIQPAPFNLQEVYDQF